MDFANLRTLFFKWLPIFLILLVIMGMALYFMRNIFPNWQTYQALASDVATEEAAIDMESTVQNDNDNQLILERLIEDTQGKLNTVGDNFLSQSEAEQVLKRLYDYAYSRGVRITSLQAQPSQAAADMPYTSSLFQIQVTGGVANLIDFISHFREASLPSVNIVSMSVTQADDQAALTMSLQIYTSPYASGQALDQLPTLSPTPDSVSATPTPTPTQLPPTATPTMLPPTATPTPTQLPPTATPTFTPTLVPTFTPTLPPTVVQTFTSTPQPSETVVVCAGAQPTLFQVGDVAVVHFSDMGALRVLSDPNGSVMTTRTQAYDKQRLEIIAGPVCANSSYYWYIRNLSANNALGWVAEGKADERWLCPESDPVCSP